MLELERPPEGGPLKAVDWLLGGAPAEEVVGPPADGPPATLVVV